MPYTQKDSVTGLCGKVDWEGRGEILGSERTKEIKGKKPYHTPPEMQAVKKQSQK